MSCYTVSRYNRIQTIKKRKVVLGKKNQKKFNTYAGDTCCCTMKPIFHKFIKPKPK